MTSGAGPGSAPAGFRRLQYFRCPTHPDLHAAGLGRLQRSGANADPQDADDDCCSSGGLHRGDPTNVDGQTATITLNNTRTARDFASLLLLILGMHDLFGRDKHGQLAAHSPAARANPPTRPAIWATGRPHTTWRSLRRRRPEDLQPGIVIIARIDSGLDAIADAGGSFQLTIDSLD